MAGRRALNRDEERRLLAVIRKYSARDRALVCAGWFTGLRISEVLALTVGHVYRDGVMRNKIGLAPRFVKGKRGRTRWIPISQELYRALVHHIWHLRLKYELTDDMPLFASRQCGDEGALKPLTRVQAHNIVKGAFAAAGIEDDGRLGTHTLRKTLAKNAYEQCDHDLIVLRDVLGHSDVITTQKYLEPEEDRVMSAIRAADFTRNRPSKEALHRKRIPAPPAEVVSVIIGETKEKQMSFL